MARPAAAVFPAALCARSFEIPQGIRLNCHEPPGIELQRGQAAAQQVGMTGPLCGDWPWISSSQAHLVRRLRQHSST
jgi:hypothetical protein